MDEPVTAKSDIFRLDLVLYELLAGELAYPEESITSLLHKQLSEPVPLLMDIQPELPPDVDAVINAQVGDNRGEITIGDRDLWLFEGQAGDVLTLSMASDTTVDWNLPDDEWIELGMINTYLFVTAPDGSLLDFNNDDQRGELALNSVIEGLVLPVDGTYQIQARSFQDR